MGRVSPPRQLSLWAAKSNATPTFNVPGLILFP